MIILARIYHNILYNLSLTLLPPSDYLVIGGDLALKRNWDGQLTNLSFYFNGFIIEMST